jgi:very-short-patch-repair endonuclease
MYRDQEQRDFARELRNQPADAEKRLWHFLRAEKLRGYKFRRQAAIGSYVVDFVCFSVRLIIEFDGPQHLEADAARHDEQRTSWLRSRGFRLIRFRNQELDESIHGVVDAIASALAELERFAGSPPSPALPAEGREPDVGY